MTKSGQVGVVQVIAMPDGPSQVVCGYDQHRGDEPPRFHSPRAKHIAFCYLERGHGVLREAGGHWNLAPGTVFLRLYDRLQELSLHGDPLYRLWFCCCDRLFQDALASLGVIDRRQPVLRQGPAQRPLGLWFRRRLEQARAQELQATGLLADIGEMLRICHDDSSQDDLVALAQNCMRQEPQLAVSTVAERLGLSYQTLKRAFQSGCGCTPGRWRQEQRMHLACSLLLEHGVAETAGLLGYANPFVFSQQFKKYSGRSPRQFQRELPR